MNVLVSKCENEYREFSKELFTKVSGSLSIIPEEAKEESHKGILFAVYIRTDTDNLVVMLDDEKFAEVSRVPDFVLSGGVYPNLLTDSGLLCGKTLLDKVFLVNSGTALHNLVTKSVCYPVGALETTNNYVLVFNIVISADLLKDPEIALKDGFELRPIETLKFKDLFQKEISKSLVLVKEEGSKV